MADLMTPPYLQFFDNSTPGIPLNGGFIYTYAAGTSTPKATFTDYTEGTPAQNPIQLDTLGRATVWVSGAYRFLITDSLGNTIRDVDHVTSFNVADAAAAAYFQTFSGDGVTTVFTVSQDLGTDEKALFIDVDAGAGAGYNLVNPNAYTINGTTLTFSVAPAAGTNNVAVRAPLTLLNAASAAAAAAATSETNAAASAVLASQWATLTSGIVAATDYSAKAWAIGGTGVTTTSGKGAAKEWATTTGGAVDTSEFSAKEYAIGTTATVGSAKSWATKTSGLVASTDGSAKAWAIGGTGVTTTASAGAAKEWATTTGGAVDTSEYSAKEYAVGTTVAVGSSKDWATKTSAAVSTTFSAKEYAQGTQAATGGSAKNWSQQTGADVTGASSHDRSAKSWAQEDIAGATLGGSAKDWAQSASKPDGTSESSKTYAAQAAASAVSAASIAAGINDTSTTSLAIGTGAKTFTVSAGKQFAAGQFFNAISAANAANYMHGTVTSYTGTSLVTNVTDIGGSGTKADWNISISGSQGATGSPGASGSVPIAAAAGTVDAITGTPSGITLADMALCAIVSAGANTITTPTFAPNSLTAHTITARGGSALLAGDCGPAGYVMLLEYNLANTRWELLNPAKIAAGDIPNLTLTNAMIAAGTIDLTAKVTGLLPYANGGTGASALTNHGVVVAGATALSTVAPGTSGNILTSNGTDWASTAPASQLGGSTTSSNGSNLTLTSSSNRYQVVTMTAAGLAVILPDATTMTAGAVPFVIKNGGTYSFTIDTNNTRQPRAILQPGDCCLLLLSDISTAAGIWHAANGNAGGWISDLFNANGGNAYSSSVASGADCHVCVSLTATTFLFCYYDSAATAAFKGVVLTITGETLAAGSIQVIEAIANGVRMAVTTFSSTLAFVTYSTTATFKAMALSISGTTISTNVAIVIEAVVVRNVFAFPVSSTQVYVGYSKDTGTKSAGVAVTVSGTTLTAGTIVYGAATLVAAEGVLGICQLTTTAYFYAYGGTTGYLAAQIFTVSGTVVTANTALTAQSNSVAVTNINAVTISSTLVAIALNQGSTSLCMYMFSISGTTPALVWATLNTTSQWTDTTPQPKGIIYSATAGLVTVLTASTIPSTNSVSFWTPILPCLYQYKLDLANNMLTIVNRKLLPGNFVSNMQGQSRLTNVAPGRHAMSCGNDPSQVKTAVQIVNAIY